MALQTELLENVAATLEVALSTAAGSVAVWYEGAEFDTTKHDEWIRSQNLGNLTQFVRQRSPTTFAHISNYIQDFSSFVKTAKSTNIRRHIELRDVVAAAFPVNKHFPIMNYNGDGLTEVGRLRVEQIITDQSLPEDDGIIGWAFTFRSSFIYEFNKP